jgi:GST-like protein
MIHLHTWGTPNGHKISIMLEELGWPYEVHAVNIGQNEQFAPAFLALSPNNKIPAIVDDEAAGGSLSIFESGAILTYLADKSGRFLAPAGAARYKALEWLFWQVGGIGPNFGQLGFFAVRAAEKSALAINRFSDECDRLLGVMDKQLSKAPWLAGEYSIADMACYPWLAVAASYLKEPLNEKLEGRTAVQDWLQRMAERPAVQRGLNVPKKI